MEDFPQRFLVQMLCGIQASKDVKLSNISRSLNEQIPLIKTETRLWRWVVQAVFYFISVEFDKKLKLNLLLKKIYQKAKRFFEIPDFRQYAIADRIYRVLFASKTGIIPDLERKEAEGQLPLSFTVHLS